MRAEARTQRKAARDHAAAVKLTERRARAGLAAEAREARNVADEEARRLSEEIKAADKQRKDEEAVVAEAVKVEAERIKVEAKAARQAEKNLRALEKLQAKEEVTKERARRRAMRSELRGARSMDRERISTLRRAQKMGISVEQFADNQPATAHGRHRWDIESGHEAGSSASTVFFDWREADMPEPVPDRR